MSAVVLAALTAGVLYATGVIGAEDDSAAARSESRVPATAKETDEHDVASAGLDGAEAVDAPASETASSLTEEQVAEEIADIIAYSGAGRRLSGHGDFAAAEENRRETLRRVRELAGRTDHFRRPLRLLEQAADASLAAVLAYDACGAVDCAAEESATATATKQRFVSAFNPIAREVLGETFAETDL